MFDRRAAPLERRPGFVELAAPSTAGDVISCWRSAEQAYAAIEAARSTPRGLVPMSPSTSGAKDVGLSIEDAATAAATGAFEAAEEIGESAVHAVSDVAASGVGGVKAVILGQKDT